MKVWGTIIMQKKYKGQDYFFVFLVTLGCSIFILYPVMTTSLVSDQGLILLLDPSSCMWIVLYAEIMFVCNYFEEWIVLVLPSSQINLCKIIKH